MLCDFSMIDLDKVAAIPHCKPLEDFTRHPIGFSILAVRLKIHRTSL